MSVSRRTFIKLGLGTGGGLVLVGAAHIVPGGLHALDEISEPTLTPRWPEAWIPSVCTACGDVCPLLLRRIERKVVGVRPLNPKPCARAYTIPQELYHPDRVTSALRRQGARGEGTWERIDLQRALQEVAGLLRRSGPRTAFIIREEAGLSFALLEALGQSLRARLVASPQWPPGQLACDALQAATGWSAWQADLMRVRGIVSFGFDWLQSFPNPAQAQRAFAMLKSNHRPIISVGPRFDRTAMKSGQWLSCRPGFEPMVALAAAHVIVKEERYDPSCLDAPGFENFKTTLREFSLEECEKKAGVSRQKIEQLARDLAAGRLLCLAPRRRLQDQWPVAVLNALLGLIARPGGWIPRSQVGLPSASGETCRDAEALPELVESGEIDTVLLVGVNLAFQAPEPSRWRKALHMAGTVICLTSLMDETAAWADLVLPLAQSAERAETYAEADEAGGIRISRVEPALAASGLVRPEEWVFELAADLGRLGTDAFPWRDGEEAAASLAIEPAAPGPFRFPEDASWTAPDFGQGDYHLHFEISATLPRMQGGHLPYLITTVGPHLREWWATWIEINPETARRLGLQDRDLVRLESEGGRIEARVKIFAGVPPDLVCLPLGLGHRTGTFAQKEGGNPAELLVFRRDENTGIPLWDFQKIRIRKES